MKVANFVSVTIVVISSMFLLTGCLEQDPFPAGNVYTKPQALYPSPTPELDKLFPDHALNVPGSVMFQEGTSGEFDIHGQVLMGNPVVTVTGAPPGSSYDAGTGKFTWTPDARQGHDPVNGNLFKDYIVHVSLASDVDESATLDQDVELVVMSVALPLGISAPSIPADILEGSALSFVIKVASPDYPSGPFGLSWGPLPSGATLTPVVGDPTSFTFNWNVPFTFATAADAHDGRGFYKTVNLGITAFGPRGQSVTQAYSFTVHDVRQLPLLVAPGQLSFPFAGQFSVSAEDENGEVAPTITAGTPAFGTVTVQQQPAQNQLLRPSRQAVIVWSGIPPQSLGTPTQLTVTACVNPDPQRRPDCTSQNVTVVFTSQAHQPPLIDRSQWASNQVQVVKLGSSLTVPLRVTDPDTSGDLPVDIEPASVRSQVSFSSGVLTVTPSGTGPFSFDLRAVTGFGVSGHESFTVQVLPRNWASMLVLGDSPLSDEGRVTLSLLGDSQMLNPSMDSIDASALLQRKALFFTTGAFAAGSPDDLVAELGLARSSLSHLIVSTPLLGRLPLTALPAGLSIAGRYSELRIPRKPPLNTLTVAAARPFTPSTQSVQLGLKLTAESSNPLVFSVSADPAGNCTPVLSLGGPGLRGTLPIAVICSNAGVYQLFAGFEWGDLVLSQADAGLSQTWIQQFLQLQGRSGPR